MDDNKTLMVYRGTQCWWSDKASQFREVGGLLTAPHFSQPFTRLGTPIFGLDSDNEDIFLFRTPRGVHALMHSMLKDHGKLHKKKRTGYAFGGPDGLSWELVGAGAAAQWED